MGYFTNIVKTIKKTKEQLVTEERLVPEFQQNVPWLKPHIERYLFASSFIKLSDSCLDIATGAGYGADLLSKHCASVVGIDKSEVTIKYARSKYPNCDFRTLDFFYNNYIADAVISFETIEHIDAPISSVLLSLAGRTKRILICSFPYMERNGANHYHYHFNLNEGVLNPLQRLGEIEIYFQPKEPEYKIKKILNPTDRQNIIFIFYPKH